MPTAAVHGEQQDCGCVWLLLRLQRLPQDIYRGLLRQQP